MMATVGAAEWLALLPGILLAGGGTLLFSLGALRPGRAPGLLFGVALLACVGAGGAALLPLPTAPSFPFLDLGGFSRFYAFLFAAITAITLLFSRQYARARNFPGDEYPGVLLFATLGMYIVAASVHWLIFFLGLELLSLSLYILIAMPRGNLLATEAAVKYFIPGAVASAVLVFGIALVYAGSGTLSLAGSLAFAAGQEDSRLLFLGLALILVGIGFKVSLVPFHLWTPDVYQGAPAPVTAFLATGAKIALFALLVRLALYSPAAVRQAFFPVLWLAAALTMAVGNVTALVQDSVKRLLAYSSIAHMGYLLMALLAVQSGGAPAILFYSLVYAISDLGAFGILGLLSTSRAEPDRLPDLRGLGHRQPGKAALLTLCLFSLAGLPATAGFIGKFVLFQAVFAQHLLILGLIGLGTVIVSIAFYIKVVILLYMQPGISEAPGQEQAGPAGMAACLLVAAIIFWLGLLPSQLLDMIGGLIGG